MFHRLIELFCRVAVKLRQADIRRFAVERGKRVVPFRPVVRFFARERIGRFVCSITHVRTDKIRLVNGYHVRFAYFSAFDFDIKRFLLLLVLNILQEYVEIRAIYDFVFVIAVAENIIPFFYPCLLGGRISTNEHDEHLFAPVFVYNVKRDPDTALVAFARRTHILIFVGGHIPRIFVKHA